MKKCAFYFITGSSGSGKTTLLKGVNKTVYPNLITYSSDAFGVPSIEEMDAKFGGPEQWQAKNTHQLFLKADRSSSLNLVVFDSQARPTVILEEAIKTGNHAIHITLIECSHQERRKRLLEYRNQPELDTVDMYAWAAYLRGQADALKLEVMDTTNQSVTESIQELAASIGRFAEENGIRLVSLTG
jgi:energy-coupling factor transporter ATP-binding protein EcfA2